MPKQVRKLGPYDVFAAVERRFSGDMSGAMRDESPLGKAEETHCCNCHPFQLTIQGSLCVSLSRSKVVGFVIMIV